MTKDLTAGKPLRVLLRFALPILLGMLLQQVYNMADTMLVGRFLGEDALGGVGSTGSLNFMVVGSCSGLCAGFAIPVSNAFGAGDMRRLRRCVAGCIYLTAAIAVSVTAVVSPLSTHILLAMNTTAENLPYAKEYIFVIFLGIPFTMLYNMSASIIRATGNSRTPVVFLSFAVVANILLDIVFIAWFELGVMGAALATVISQVLSGVLCLSYILRRLTFLRFEPGEAAFSWKVSGTLLLNGLPMAFQYGITAIGSVLMQTAINSLGADYVNAVAVTGRLYGLFASFHESLGSAMATFSGQNSGAGKFERIRQGATSSMIVIAVYEIFYVAAVYFFTPALITLFLADPGARLIMLVRQNAMCSALFSLLLGSVVIYRFSIQGMGYSFIAIFAGVMEMLARAAMALFLVPLWGYTAVCLASPLAWLMASVFLVPAHMACRKRLISRHSAAAKA